MNRSLNSERFRIATGYNPPDWHSLVKYNEFISITNSEEKQ